MYHIKYYTAKTICFISGISFIALLLQSIALLIYCVDDYFILANLEASLKGSTLLLCMSLILLWNPKILKESNSVDFFQKNSFDQQKETINKQLNKSQTTIKILIGSCLIILIISWIKFL
ncbi:hypothetical protein [Nonlabens sp.]|uniref:hypothetical protein n=1 Tax=Nonlabens sp. TaxID=1888209 RepID=UPI003F696C65